MTVRNLTGEEISLRTEAGWWLTLPAEPETASVIMQYGGEPAWLLLEETDDGSSDGWVSLREGTKPEVVGLPDPSPGTSYIVTADVAMAVPGRTDVYYPIAPIHDGDRIIGWRRLGQLGEAVPA